MNKIKVILLTIIFILSAWPVRASLNLSQKLSGRILLQVESFGQAWYVNPADQKKYSLGRPSEAFLIMKQLGVGITNSDLNKISTDINFTKKHLGKIFLQVEARGQAWYVNPADQKKYSLGSPDNALAIMRNLGLGITNADLEKITIGYAKNIITPPAPCANCYNNNTRPSDILSKAAQVIRTGETEEILTYFTPELSKAIEYTMAFLKADGKLTLANILSGSSLNSSSENEKIYSNEVYFSLGGYNVVLKFHVKKQSDGTWLIANL